MGPDSYPPPPPPPLRPPPPFPDPTAQIEPYRSLHAIARALMVLLVIGLTLDLIAVFSDVAERGLLQRAETEGITFSEADANDRRQVFIGLTQAAVYIATIPVFLVWFRRAYRNLPALGARSLRYRPGWAVGGWFVPFLNLVRPVQITNDIWRASDPEMTETVDTPWLTGETTPLIGFWWGAWIVSNWVGQFAFRTSVDAEQMDELQRASAAWLTSDVAYAITTLLALLVVRQITQREEVRAEKMSQSAVP